MGNTAARDKQRNVSGDDGPTMMPGGGGFLSLDESDEFSPGSFRVSVM